MSRGLVSAAMALSLAGCLDEDPPAYRFTKPVDVFGTGDTLVYIGDTARFSVRTAPKDVGAGGFAWILHRGYEEKPYDSVETAGPVLERVFTAAEAGRHAIRVRALGMDEYQYDWTPFGFFVRVDLGRPAVALDTVKEFPFGSGNRYRVRATDPDGRVVKYHWSTVYNTFTDSTDGPVWALPDTLLDGESIYCRVRDDKGQYSDTARISIRVLPRGIYGTVRDDFRGILPMADGGFLAAGHTQSFDTRLGEPWVARLDSSGALTARTTVKASASFGVYGTGRFNGITAGASDFHLAFGVYSDSRDTTRNDILVAAFDGNGRLRTQGIQLAPGDQELAACARLANGDWMAVGSSLPNRVTRDTTFGLVALVGSHGTLDSTRVLKRGASLTFKCIAPTADGNALVGAVGTVNFSTQAGYLYKLTPAGDSLWAKPIELGGFAFITPHALIACKAGGFALLAFGSNGALVHRLDEEGKVRWTRMVPSAKEEWPRAGSLAEDPMGGLLVGLDLPFKANPPGIQLTRLDDGGEILWSRRLGRYEDDLYTLAAVPSGGFIAAGSLMQRIEFGTAASAWVFRFDMQGRMLW